MMHYSNQLSNVKPTLPCALCLVAQWCPTLHAPMDCNPPGSSVHGDSPGRNTGVGCHALLRGSSWPRDWTQLSRIAGGLFTVWTTREAQPGLLVMVSCSVAKSCPTPCDPVNCSTLASLSFTISGVCSLMSVEPVMPSNHPILCHPLLLLLLVMITWSFFRPTCLMTHRRRKCNPRSLVGTLILDCWPPERCGNKFLFFTLLSLVTSLGQPDKMIQTPSK